MIYPNITQNEGPKHIFQHFMQLIKKQASHQNADLISLANLLNFEIEMSSMRCKYHGMLKILIKWVQFIFLDCDFFKENIWKIIIWNKIYEIVIWENITRTLKNVISQNKCDRLQIYYNSLEWTIKMALRWGKIISYLLTVIIRYYFVWYMRTSTFKNTLFTIT